MIKAAQSSKISDALYKKPAKRSEQLEPKRKVAKTIGGALLLMAILAGIAIPAVGTLQATFGLIGIFLLDIVVSIGIYKYFKAKSPKLATVAGFLRMLYTSILGVAIGYHAMGNVLLFNKIWGIGLIVFGMHLITLGILFNKKGIKKWVKILMKALLIIAGLGYLIQYVGILFVANPVVFAALIESIFIVPMILGEVLFASWMLIKGGRAAKQNL